MKKSFLNSLAGKKSQEAIRECVDLGYEVKATKRNIPIASVAYPNRIILVLDDGDFPNAKVIEVYADDPLEVEDE